MNKSVLIEGLNYKEMVGLIKPTVHVDEFVSKMGEDSDVAVLSFYVRNEQVAEDLINWFEKGYEFILDADRSPGEVRPNRFLVYIEVPRRTRLIDQIQEILEDFETLTEHELENWTFTIDGEDVEWNPELLRELMILSPRRYRQEKEDELNEMRTSANLPTKKTYDNDKDPDINKIREQAGLL